MRAHAFIVAALLALAGAAVPGQSPRPQAPAQPPTFKVEVNYVEIDATVTDAQGRFVDDLTKEDFQVVEEGKPQTVSAFTRVDVPIERPDPPLFRQAAIEPDVRSNRDAFTGRVFLLVMDDLQTAPSRTMLVRAAARQFIRRYGRRQRHGCGGDDRGKHNGRPGVHEQPPAPAGRGGQVHGAEDTPRCPGHGAELQGSQHLRNAWQCRRVHDRDPRPAQGHHLVRRRRRLQHRELVRLTGRRRHPIRHARTRLRRRPART